MRSLTLDEKAMRRARIDDWCARNRVETIPARPQVIADEELKAIAGLKHDAHFWGRRRQPRKPAGGPKPS